MDILEQLVLVAAIIGYGVALSRIIPSSWHFVTNVLAAVTAIVFGLWKGLDYSTMGLSVNLVKDGIIVALAATILIIIGVAIVTRIPPLKRFFNLQQIMKPGRVVFETAVRIPLSTALTEEILFRGVLLGMFMQFHGAVLGAVYSSLVFGVWHILPSQQGLKDRHGDSLEISSPIKSAYTVVSVSSTAIAGMLFCWLRILAGSILAPWLVHWTINSSALLASHAVSKKNSDK